MPNYSEVSEQALALCHAIERLPASEQATEISQIASDLRMRVVALESLVTTSPKLAAAEKIYSAACEFLSDWRKGDFDLPKLAQHDAASLQAACDGYCSAVASEVPRLYFTVTTLTGEQCTFDSLQDAETAAIGIANTEGWSSLACSRMRPSVYNAMPATNASARIADMSKSEVTP